MDKQSINSVIKLTCPDCNNKLLVDTDDFLGKYVVCYKCGTRIKWKLQTENRNDGSNSGDDDSGYDGTDGNGKDTEN